MNNKIITLDEAIDSLRGHPGIVVGPLVTAEPNSFSLLVENIVSSIGGIEGVTSDNLAIQLDALRSEFPSKADSLEDNIVTKLGELQSYNDISYLAKAGWSMCISLTKDMIFEAAIQNYQDTLPSSKTVTIIDHVTVRPQSRTIPIYKLLGNLLNHEAGHALELSESKLLLKKRTWSPMLGTCTDFLQGSPLLFFGAGSEVELVQELLSSLSTLPQPAPNSLIFLKDDPLLENPTIRSLCNSFSSVKVVDATIREFAKAIKNMKPRQAQLNLSLDDKAPNLGLSTYNSIISIVPTVDIVEDLFLLHKNSLVDSLFKPTAIDWDPYLCNLDLRRDCTEEILNVIKKVFDEISTNKPSSLIIRGDAGVGKTVALKRVAVEVGKSNVISIWCRRAPVTNWIRTYKELAADMCKMAGEDPDGKQKFVVFVDDPWSLRLDPAELVACFECCKAQVVFVFALRNTEYFNQNGFSLNLPFLSQYEIEVPTKLTEAEISGLSNMLTRIGAVSSTEEADKLIKQLPTKNSDDVLCSLWYLVPEARSNLAESLTNEYHRLGAVNGSISEFAQNAQLGGESVQHAYEYVCVTSKFHIALPMEVLVRSLKINYEDFIEMTIDGKPLWGLLYAEDDPENQTVLYRTRNEIVTRVLLQLVNGGVGHAGEFRVLKTLLSSCDVGSQIYRDFALEVLIRTSKELENNLSYEQGLELFKAAEDALPYEDRLLAHHKGIWMQRVGKDYQEAYSQFENALNLQQYPGSREAHIEHIQTSMAASVVGLIREGKQSPSDGLQLVQDHIQKASNPKIFTAHTGHISANLLFEVAQQENESLNKNVTFQSLSGALQEIEKTMQAIGPYWRKGPKFDKSIEMLKSLQQKVVGSISDEEDLEKYAYKVFDETGDQMGFELLLRKQFVQAQIDDKGGKYNNVKINIEKILEYVDGKNTRPCVEIIAIRTDLTVRWRLQKARGNIDWNEFKEDLQFILEYPKYRDDPIKNFYLAVALFHLGYVEQANAIFSNLRRLQALGLMPREVRSFMIGPEGFPKRYQCTIERRHERSYAEIPELNLDIPVAGSNREIVTHTYVGFSLNGPIAIFNKPDDNQVLLA